MKAIGGYFEIEETGAGVFPHEHGILLNTGRNALEYVLRSLPDVNKVYLPYYTCEVVLEPIKKLALNYSFYHINENFEIAEDISLGQGEYLIANNYYGIKDSYIRRLAEYYGDRLIVDSSQAFFAPVLPDIKMFYSARKFVGVPDGGIAYGVDAELSIRLEQDNSVTRTEHLYTRRDKGAEAGFTSYQANEKKLDGQPILKMSEFTKKILFNIDYQTIRQKRWENFKFLHKALQELNLLRLPVDEQSACPMIYPFYSNSLFSRDTLIKNKIFIARYWSNVFDCCNRGDLEYKFVNHILPLPIDQRYNNEEMTRIVDVILG